MDRIFAIRNIGGVIRDLESGDTDLASTKQRVVIMLWAFAMEFEDDAGDGTLDTWTAVDDDHVEGLVVFAADAGDARARVRDLLDGATGDTDDVTFSAERVWDNHRGGPESDSTTARFYRHRHRLHHPLVSYS